MSADAGPHRLVGGRYALGEILGRGGMGVVWQATDRLLDRRVAVKELTFAVGVTEAERTVLCERTMREARAAGRLDHPCVTTIYDVVQEAGKPWLVMEHVDGESLQQLLERSGPLPPAAVARIGLDVLAALEAAHAAGIVHRDVKPANVLIERGGRACLTDFGIATTTGESSLTTQGALIGSPSYMAPERIHGDQPQPAVDLWSLGATLYAAVEGRPPFGRPEPMATAMAVVSEHPAPMVRAGPLQPVLRGLLEKDPAARATAARARRQLEEVAAGRCPVPSPPAAPRPAPRPAEVPDEPLHRFDASDLRQLAAASASALGTVAREARGQARSLAGTRRARRPPTPPPAPPATRRRRRFKRRWVVVPLITILVIAMAMLAGLVWVIGRMLGAG